MPKKLTKAEVIAKARAVHGNKYDYSKVVYVNARTKVCIICPEHGEFWAAPSNHLRGKGCKMCNVGVVWDTESFKTNATKIHGVVYDYSKVVYINNSTKVCIICPEHGEFWQTPNNHLNGKGCPTCGRVEAGVGKKKHHKSQRPDLSHIETPPGSRAVPVGDRGDYALVDKDDYDRVMQYNWCLSHGYAISTVGDKHIRMHRLVMDAPDDMVVDHRFHNTLDNRKSQLRVCTHAENLLNVGKFSTPCTSQYKGVWWNKKNKKWIAGIKIFGKAKHLGCFDSETAAAKVYNEAALRHRGEFAVLNVIANNR